MFKILSNWFGSKPKTKQTQRSTQDEWVPKHNKTPEELCSIDPNVMTAESIKKHLAVLYKRYNDAVSSMKPELRAESRYMLEAIAECRDRYVDSAE